MSSNKSEVLLPLLVFILTGGVALAIVGYWYDLFDGLTKSRLATNRRSKKGRISGLYNLGNTCFVNALLQAWASCPSITSWLYVVLGELEQQLEANLSQPNDANQESRDKPFLAALAKIIAELNLVDGQTVSAQSLLDALHHHRWHLDAGSEQDCQELMDVFCTTLDEELDSSRTQHNVASLLSLEGLAKLENAEANHRNGSRSHNAAFLRSLSQNIAFQTRLRLPFAGIIASQLQCRRCGKKHVKHDDFSSLPVLLARNNNSTRDRPLTLECCLRQYFATEIVADVTCENCSLRINDCTNSQKSSFIKKHGISKLPAVLVIIINRNRWLGNGEQLKDDAFIHVPETLDVRDFVFYRNKSVVSLVDAQSLPSTSTAQTSAGGSISADVSANESDGNPSASGCGSEAGLLNIIAGKNNAESSSPLLQREERDYTYSLCAVIEHLGAASNSGHFVCYRKFENGWFYTSDLNVRSADISEVLNCQAYSLFYERNRTAAAHLPNSSTEN